MRRKLYFLLVLLLINATILPGCWNYREIEQFAIVAGMAVDKGEQGNYLLTIEIVDMHEGGREGKIQSERVETYGETLLDAIRNAIKISAKKLYWGHSEIVVLSQDVAKEGILEILDWLDRDAEPRLSMDLLVSKERTAREVLEAQSITMNIRSYEVNEMLDSQRNLSKASKVEVYEFVSALTGQGISPVLPAVRVTKNQGKNKSELSGTAVFKKTRFEGFLDEEETKYLLFATDKIKGGLIVLLEDPEDEYAKMALEILRSKTKITPQYSEGKISMALKIKMQVMMDEHGTQKSFVDGNGNLLQKKKAEAKVAENIQQLIHKVQKEYDTDIFGFGSIVKADMPAVWKQMGQDWDDIFKDLNVSVEVNIETKNSGLMWKSIEVGE